MGYRITNLTGVDFFDCHITYCKNGKPVDLDEIGTLRMGDSTVVRKWEDEWFLSGIDRYGDSVMTKPITATKFHSWDLFE